MLTSFHVQGFRGLKDLKLDGLGRANLIVGQNNVGKTTLLEALDICAAGSSAPKRVLDVLKRRGSRRIGVQSGDDAVAWESLFNAGDARLARLHAQGTPARTLDFAVEESAGATLHPTQVQMKMSHKGRDQVDLGNLKRYRAHSAAGFAALACTLILSHGMSAQDRALRWDEAAISTDEEVVLKLVRLIEPDIERIVLVAAGDEQQPRAVFARLKSRPDAVPLLSLGEGVMKVFELSLALVGARGGFLLVDEFATGVHYSLIEELWTFVLKAAAQLDVQVFATTHSWDCIEAFQRATAASPEVGTLLRIDKRGEELRAVSYSEEELAIATRQSIEVR